MKLWYQFIWGQREDRQLLEHDKKQLLQEIEKARSEWVAAQHRLDIVVEHDQIDYAIFALEASQKRLDMLFRHAKKMNVSALDMHNSK